MRTPAPFVALMLSLLLLGLPLAAAQPPSDGNNNTITASETWTEDGHMNGHVVIADGATLTVNANITMATGSSFTVEEGGQMVVTNGALVSEDLNAGWMIQPNAPTTITLNFGDLADEGVLQLKFDHAISDGVRFDVILGDETLNASGSDLVQFDVPLNATDLVLSFDTYYFTPTYVLWAKAIYGGGNAETVLAQDMDVAYAPLYWFQSAFDIQAHGDLTITSSTVSGADIHCKALCRIDGATLVGSAPVDAATTASVSVLNSLISGSRTDEDIILRDEATIDYQNSQGTGGTTDAWIRLLSERTLNTNIPRGSLDVYDMGWGAADWNDLTDENGNVVLVEDGPTNEHKRIVAWMDGNGVVHQEEASITLSITSGWGVYSTTFDAPTTSTASVEVALPFVEVTAVTPEIAEGVVNSSVSGMVTVANTGQATASGVSVWCYEGEELADTTQITVSLAPGEETDVPFTWYAYTAGEAALTCKPLLPTALNDITEDVVDLTGATSPTVMWEYAEEVEEAPIIIYTVVTIGFVALALFVASQARRSDKDYATYTEDEVGTTHEHVEASGEEEDHDEVPVDDDSAQEASDAEDAEDEEPEGLVEEDSDEGAGAEAASSIYDFDQEEDKA